MGMERWEHFNPNQAKFDSVIFMRSDTFVYARFKPFCAYNLQVARKAGDQFFWAPRQMLHTSGDQDSIQGSQKACETPSRGLCPVVSGGAKTLYLDDVALPVVAEDCNA